MKRRATAMGVAAFLALAGCGLPEDFEPHSDVELDPPADWDPGDELGESEDPLVRRVLGVENGRTGWNDFNPPQHRGVDVFAPARSRVFAPRGWTLEPTHSNYLAAYGGQLFGWVTLCGKRYGFVAAHFEARPAVRRYQSGEQIGEVAAIRATFNHRSPHIHWALAEGHIPPPGTLDPLRAWRSCLAQLDGTAP